MNFHKVNKEYNRKRRNIISLSKFHDKFTKAKWKLFDQTIDYGIIFSFFDFWIIIINEDSHLNLISNKFDTEF